MQTITDDPILSNTNKTTFSPREFVFKYLKYLPLLILGIAISLIFAYIKWRYSTPIYKVQASMLINNENSGRAGSDRFEDLFFSTGNVSVGNEIEILKSRPMMKRVVQNLNIQLTYFNKGNIKTSMVYGDLPFFMEITHLNDSSGGLSLLVTIVNGDRFRVNEGQETYSFNQPIQNSHGKFRLVKNGDKYKSYASNEFIVRWLPLSSAAEELVGSLQISPINDRSNILRLSMETQHPVLGRDILNTLMEVYDMANIEDKNRKALNTLKFIDERLDTIKRELGGLELYLQNFQEKNQAFDLEGQAQMFSENFNQATQQQINQNISLRIIDWLISYVNDSTTRTTPVPTMLDIREPVLAPLITEYNKLQFERETNLKTIPAGHPIIKNIDVGIAKLRRDILEAGRNVRQSYIIAKNSLENQSSVLRGQIQSVPGKYKRALEIKREQKILENLYSLLLQKKLETSISSAATISNSKVVEPAIGSSTPIRPTKRGVYMFYLMFGIAIPIALVAIKEFFNDKVNSRADVERITDAPILGEIGHSSEQSTLVVQKNNRRFIAEQFRIIRTNLRYIINKVENPVILVTSSFSGEGKSFASINMGAVMALTGKRTVILELDIRKPKVVSNLELKRQVGITNFLVGRTNIESLILPVPEVENLFVIPCGPVPPNPAEMLLDSKMKELFDYVRKNFDFTIVDTAPVGLVSDAIVIGAHADCTLYILRHGYTFKKQVGLIDELYKQKKLPKLSLLLNDVETTGGYGSYSGYQGYGYGYGYGSNGYFQDEEKSKKGFFKRMLKTIKFW